MSGLGKIASEAAQQCDLCGKVEELRPYGPKGEVVCFDCAMQDEGAARTRFRQHVLGESKETK